MFEPMVCSLPFDLDKSTVPVSGRYLPCLLYDLYNSNLLGCVIFVVAFFGCCGAWQVRRFPLN